MNRFICIHGHFYQPPRENAWLEEIEVQDSAAPYHDWNERVAAECYAPNTASRILDDKDRIVDIVNNFASISFDAGPTLLAWLERSAPDVYGAILEADRQAAARFRGHGTALAQAYNHLIMPLASSRDKRTQVLWGIRDFESRFGRRPEGMWLPETAVDLESLDIMAGEGILFTILAPRQAAAVRPLAPGPAPAQAGGGWIDVRGDRVDTKKPYLCRLPSGRTIALFFYDGPISHDLAFGDLLRNGESFARRLAGGFSAPGPERPELVHIATDGESYGHHHRFGDMALAYALRSIERNKLAEITVYGDYLERFPPADEVKIAENTSWSCAHGVERWRSDCGCSTGAHPAWNQKWRRPLREAMDWLGGKAAAAFGPGLGAYAADPWAVRDDYIEVVLDRSPASVESFLARHIARPLSAEDKVRVLKLLEMERGAMLIFTSDAWFFDDISNVETVQVVQYAARTLQLLRDVTGEDVEPEFLAVLTEAKSNVPRLRNGATVYEKLVRPAIVDFLRLAAHLAMSAVFETDPGRVDVGLYAAVTEDHERKDAGEKALAVGRFRLRSHVTWEERVIEYAVFHFGDQNITAGVRDHAGDAAYRTMCRAVEAAFARSDMAAVVRLIDQDFGPNIYSLWHLFTEQKRKILARILQGKLHDLEADFRHIFESNYTVMKAMREMSIPLPEALRTPAEFVLNTDLGRLMGEGPDLDLDELRRLQEEYESWDFKPDGEALSYAISRKARAMMSAWAGKPDDAEGLRKIADALVLMKKLAIGLDLWESQNIYFSTGRLICPLTSERAGKGDPAAAAWIKAFDAVGELLRVDPTVFCPMA
ncbi:MAG: DUF3536 domain-containing protein [Acidobacteriota bacterium]